MTIFVTAVAASSIFDEFTFFTEREKAQNALVCSEGG
jgi:hypothetical protein